VAHRLLPDKKVKKKRPTMWVSTLKDAFVQPEPHRHWRDSGQSNFHNECCNSRARFKITPLNPLDFVVQEGGELTNPQELTKVSD
jgi:hypothetical protein